MLLGLWGLSVRLGPGWEAVGGRCVPASCGGALLPVHRDAYAGQHEHYDVPSLKIRLVGHPEPIVTIPCTQKVVITMAPFLYENVKITVEAA